MVKLREVLTPEEAQTVSELKIKLLRAKTRREMNEYEDKIKMILLKAEARYYAQQEMKQTEVVS